MVSFFTLLMNLMVRQSSQDGKNLPSVDVSFSKDQKQHKMYESSQLQSLNRNKKYLVNLPTAYNVLSLIVVLRLWNSHFPPLRGVNDEILVNWSKSWSSR